MAGPRDDINRPLYMISVAAELAGVHPQTLRIYERKKLIEPQRSAGNTRLYSEADIQRLRLIQQLTQEEGVNLAGVERIMELQNRLQSLSDEIDSVRRQLIDAQREVAASRPEPVGIVRVQHGVIMRRTRGTL